MRGSLARSLLALSVLALTSPASTVAEERQWILLDPGPESVSVVYGTPHSDDVVVGFECAATTGTLTVSVLSSLSIESDEIAAEMTLASPGGRVMLPARGTFQMMDELVLFTAETRLDPPLRAVLSGSGMLRIAVLADTFEAPLAGSEAPLAGSEAAVAALSERCGGS